MQKFKPLMMPAGVRVGEASGFRRKTQKLRRALRTKDKYKVYSKNNSFKSHEKMNKYILIIE